MVRSLLLCVCNFSSSVTVRYFNRDVDCIRTFFKRRFRYQSALYPRFRKTVEDSGKQVFDLDVIVEASGFGRKELKALEEVHIFPIFNIF